MSDNNNELWLESAKEGFDYAVETGNYELAKDIIADVFDNGFTKESLVLEQLLLAAPLINFSKPTHEILWK